jgi:hypothetical protein
MSDVFISYSRVDKVFVRELYDALIRLNRDIWVDWQDIPATAEWLAEVYLGIRDADNFVFVISPESCISETCGKELDHALKNNKRLIPILHREVAIRAVPEALAKLNFIYLRDSDNFDATFTIMVEAIDADLEWTRAHTRLLMRASEWELKGRNESFLLRGVDLRDAEEWQAQAGNKEFKPTSGQSQYILVSRIQETRRERRMLGAMALALLLTAVLLVMVWIQRNEARREAAIASSRLLAAESQQALQTDLDLAIHQAVAAGERWPTEEAEQALGKVLDRPLLQMVLHHPLGVGNLSFSPDGRRILTSYYELARVWDVETGHPLVTFIGHTGDIEVARFSPDGLRVVTGSADHTARVWDAGNGHLITIFKGHTEALTDARFSADGNRIVGALFPMPGRPWSATMAPTRCSATSSHRRRSC